MPHSDRFQFKSGDRVRDRQTQEAGRVVNAVPLAGGVLLVTVAFFVGNTVRSKREYRVRPGQVSGCEIERIAVPPASAPKDPGSPNSAQAQERAQRNRPATSSQQRAEPNVPQLRAEREKVLAELDELRTHRTPFKPVQSASYRLWMREMGYDPITQSPGNEVAGPQLARIQRLQAELRRLDNALERVTVGRAPGVSNAARLDDMGHYTPGLNILNQRANTVAPEEMLQVIAASRHDLKTRLDSVRGEKREIDDLLRYLTQGGRQDPATGQWTGGYLNDVVFRGRRTDEAAKLEQKFGSIRITPEVRARLASVKISGMPLIADNAQTALDVLTQQQRRIRNMLPSERAAAFRQLSPVLKNLVEGQRGYQVLGKKQHTLFASLGRIQRIEDAVRADPIFERFNPVLDTSAMGDRHDLLGNALADARDHPLFSGDAAPGRFFTGSDLDTARRVVEDRRVFDSKFERRFLAGARKLNPDWQDLVGRTIVFQNQPYRVARLGTPALRNALGGTLTPASDRVLLQPITQKLSLYSSVPLDDAAKQFGLLDLLSQPISEAQLEDASTAMQQGAVRKLAPRESIQITQGFGSAARQGQPAPISALYDYLIGAGDTLTGESGAARDAVTAYGSSLKDADVSRFGFGTAKEFRNQARFNAGKFRRTLEQVINKQALLQQFNGLSAADVDEEIRYLILERLSQFPGGSVTLTDLERDIQQWVSQNLSRRLMEKTRSGAQETAISQLLEEGESPLDFLGRQKRQVGADSRVLRNQYEILDEVRKYRRLSRRTNREEAFFQVFGQPAPGRTQRRGTRFLELAPAEMAEYNYLVRRIEEGDPDHSLKELQDLLSQRVQTWTNRRLAPGQLDQFDRLVNEFFTGSDKRRAGQELHNWYTRQGTEIYAAGPEVRAAYRELDQYRKAGDTARMDAALLKIRELEEQAETAWQQTTRMGERPDTPVGAQPRREAITDANRGRAVQIFDRALELAEEGAKTGEFRPLPFETVPLPNDQFGLLLTDQAGSAQGERYLYQKGGRVQSLTDPTRVAYWGETDQTLRTDAGTTSVRAVERDEFLKGLKYDRRDATSYTDLTDVFGKRAMLDEVMEQALRPSGRLGYQVPGGPLPIGFHGAGMTTFERVREQSQRLLSGGKTFISLDIESAVNAFEDGRVTNVGAVRYARGNGQEAFRRTAEIFDQATPDFWQELGYTGTNRLGGGVIADNEFRKNARSQSQRLRDAGTQGQEIGVSLRSATKNGTTSVIGGVAGDERGLIAGLADYLQGALAQNPDAAIVGHNITFDLGRLIQRAGTLGMAGQQALFQSIAQDRLVDTMLLAQVGLPDARSLGLEDLSRQYLNRNLQNGRLWKEAHVALPDADLAAALVNRIHASRGSALRALEVIQPGRELSQGEFLWDDRTGRAYRLQGILDPEAYGEIYQQRLGKEPAGGKFGLAVQEMSALDAGALKRTDLLTFNTPHGFARAAAELRSVSAAEAAQLVEQRVRDLAGRRVRRGLAGGLNDADSFGPFMEFLKERERVKLGRAFAKGSQDEVAATLSDLSRRTAAAGREERRLLEGVSDYFFGERYAADDRILAQLAQQANFFAEEGEAHKAVVENLRQYVLQSAERGELRQETWKRAGAVWQRYIEETAEKVDWARNRNVQIPLEDRQLSFNLDVLGGNRQAVRVGTAGLVRGDLDELTRQVTDQLLSSEPGAIAHLYGNEGADIVTAMQGWGAAERKEFLASGSGARITEWVWEQHLRPGMLAGSNLLASEAESMSFQLQSQGRAEAVQELASAGHDYAQKVASQIPDYLQPRQLRNEAGELLGDIAAIQQRYTRPVTDLLAEMAETSARQFQRSHFVPDELVGMTFADAAQKVKTDPTKYLRYLQTASRHMNFEESLELEQLLNATGDSSYAQQVFTSKHSAKFRMMEDAAGETLERTFRPSGVMQLGQDLAEGWSRNRAGMQLAGAGAAAILGGAMLALALNRPEEETEARAPAEGFASTPGEVNRRQERIERTVPIPQKYSIRIHADDPHGMNVEELSSSIHGALGQFMPQLPEPNLAVHDQRSKFDRKRLDGLAAELMRGNARR